MNGERTQCQVCGGRAQLASRDETNNTVVSQTDEDHPNIAPRGAQQAGIDTP